jgi:aspartyl protease family protein
MTTFYLPTIAKFLFDSIMKQLFKLFIPLAGVALFQTTAIAQEADGCFMLDSAGQTIDLSTVCGQPKKASTHSSGFQTKIKRRESGIPVIDVTFNGQRKFEMLLDTGASQTTITAEMAQALGIVPVGTHKAQVASGDVVEFPFGRVDSISVGNAMVQEATVSISEGDPLLGQNFFGDYDVIIRRDVVEFHPRQS